MPSQAQIEKAAGIDEAIATYMMARQTPAANNAMELLRMQVTAYEPAGFALLQAAVDDCRKEIASPPPTKN